MTKTYSTDTLALRAANDQAAFAELVGNSEGLILRCASSTTHRFITRNDDEWSIALGAFTSAVSSYNPDKGHFYPFAELVIKHRVLDYVDSNAHYCHGMPAVPEKVAYSQDDSLRWEIGALGIRLSFYGIAFAELASCSPRTSKTRRRVAVAVAAILRNPILLLEMQTTRVLPIVAITELTDLPRKFLERHRKYIIVAAEIFDGGYDVLTEYMQYIREEIKQ